jgi:arylsulfatase A-like enzyme
MYQVVLASIPFEGIEAAIYAGAFSLAVVSLIGGYLLRRRVNASLKPAAGPNVPARSRTLESAAFWLFLLAADITVPALIGVMDWNSVLEKVWAISWWVMVGIVVVFRKPVPLRRRTWVPIATVAVCVFALRAGARSEASWGRALSVPQFDAATALEHHSALDASFAAASELLETSSKRDCDALCQFALEQTNIPASAVVKLPNINLVQDLAPAGGKKPNIFIIVVDSLRQDYLSPYNPGVSFTPAIGAFARDSVVFRNAFTRYGGTTLSEPSIWSGMMQLHKHYVQPFSKVNGLEKLIKTDGYKPFVSVDTVLRVLLQPSQDMVKLDSNAEKWTNVDFCSTSKELVQRIDQGQSSGRPVFFFSQPQNVHVITLETTSKLRPPTKNYAPFVSYYASELQRLDGCFGNFIDALKSRGLYENSIIVLTADHGEDLKRMGAERHSFSLRPEVIRVPLIMHVPQAVKEHWYYDPNAIAFNTDITPTLYELLGHEAVIARPEFGRPLFTRTAAEQQKYLRDSYMIASSYGALYGLLYHNGTGLFIADLEVTGREEFFDLAKDPGATHNILTDKLRQQCEAQLRLDIQQIADLYGYRYKAATLLGWLMR